MTSVRTKNGIAMTVGSFMDEVSRNRGALHNSQAELEYGRGHFTTAPPMIGLMTTTRGVHYGRCRETLQSLVTPVTSRAGLAPTRGSPSVVAATNWLIYCCGAPPLYDGVVITFDEGADATAGRARNQGGVTMPAPSTRR